ncbi:J domain-containing protein [Chondrinema litorale]|uniref:J domain-containing protein n=1 Tax=Chondrinema litorale TaxID=2994555 RepID=UPI0025429069|nr:J domain-containing protein [Chondrinema litorale]UZR94347.1 J domain-containing protein [Chondrinema litorale]
MLDRIKDILKAELSDKVNRFTNFKSVGDLEIDEILENLKKQYNTTGNTETHQAEQESNYQYQETNSNTNTSSQTKEQEYYTVLEVPFGSDYPTIKKSYRKLMKVYHPDLYHNDKEKFEMAKEVSQKLNEAYVYFKNKYEK